jgi:hypothetical protein
MASASALCTSDPGCETRAVGTAGNLPRRSSHRSSMTDSRDAGAPRTGRALAGLCTSTVRALLGPYPWWQSLRLRLGPVDSLGMKRRSETLRGLRTCFRNELCFSICKSRALPWFKYYETGVGTRSPNRFNRRSRRGEAPQLRIVSA